MNPKHINIGIETIVSLLQGASIHFKDANVTLVYDGDTLPESPSEFAEMMEGAWEFFDSENGGPT